MQGGQIITAAVGVGAVAIGIWLLLHSARGASSQSEARLPLVSFSGPPGLLLVVLGVVMTAFPFTPWWPSTTPSSSPSSQVWTRSIEAESGDIVPPMSRVSDDSASGQAYVTTDQKDQGSVSFEFAVPAEGRYFFWGRVSAPGGSAGANSLLVSLDGGDTDIWDFFEEDTPNLPSGWKWDRMSLRCQGGDYASHLCNPWSPYLAAGNHELLLKGRERDARIDKVLVTNDPEYMPAG